MDKKSKILLAIVIAAIAGSVFATYYRYIIKKNYYIEAQTDCDPRMEVCFVSVCDPATDSECPQAEAERATYYKLIKKKASNIPLCDPNDADCAALDCSDKTICEETLCDPANPGEGVTCNDPEKYNADNPVVEDVAPGDNSDESVTDESTGGDNIDGTENVGDNIDSGSEAGTSSGN